MCSEEIKIDSKTKNDDQKKKVIMTFSECENPSLIEIGGKAFNLTKLFKSFPIPNGFVITTAGFMTYLQHNGKLVPDLTENLKKLVKLDDRTRFAISDLKFLKIICGKLKTIIMSGEMPKVIIESVESILKTSEFKDKSFAVRSSCTSEDLKGNSFAGIYETYLNIKGPQNILEMIKECWGSLFSPRSIQYLCLHGFMDDLITYKQEDNKIPNFMPKMAVVVQEMVFGDFAGVIFTTDPLAQNRNVMVIETVIGLGEMLVSGAEAADHFRVLHDLRTEKNEILSKEIKKKKKFMTKSDGNNTGTIIKEVPNDLQEKQSIPDETILELSKIGRKVEKFYKGIPQDIEFAIRDGKIFVLQSREITNLWPWGRKVDYNFEEGVEFDAIKYDKEMLLSESDMKVYYDFGRSQAMLDPWKPLGMSIFLDIFNGFINEFGLQKWFKMNNMFINSGERLMIDATSFLEQMKNKKGKTDSYVRDVSQYVLNREKKVLKKQQKNMKKFVAQILTKLCCKLICCNSKVSKEISNAYFSTCCILNPCCKVVSVETYEKENENILSQYLNDMDLREINKNEKIDEQISIASHNANELSKGLMIGFSKFMAVGICTLYPSMYGLGCCLNTMIKEKDWDALVSGGVEGNITTEFVLTISDLSDMINGNNEIIQILQEAEKISKMKDKKLSFEMFIKKYGNKIEKKGGEEFIKKFTYMMKRHGFRGNCEIDITNDRFNENIGFILTSMLVNLNQPKGTNRKRFEEARLNTNTEVKRLILKGKKKSCCSCLNLLTCGWFGCTSLCCISRMMKLYIETMKFREHPKYYFIRVFDTVRKGYRRIGKLFLKAGYLEDERDIDYFSGNEVRSFLKRYKKIKKSYIKEFIKHRKSIYESAKKFKVSPAFVTSEGEKLDVSFERDNKIKGDRKQRCVPGELITFGDGLATGEIKAKVRIISHVDDIADLKPGEIAVTHHTDPGWTPLFLNCVGLILETGGAMSHGILVAREMGIPAISGLPKIQEWLRTGDVVKMNGATGKLEILERPKEDHVEVEVEKELEVIEIKEESDI